MCVRSFTEEAIGSSWSFVAPGIYSNKLYSALLLESHQINNILLSKLKSYPAYFALVVTLLASLACAPMLCAVGELVEIAETVEYEEAFSEVTLTRKHLQSFVALAEICRVALAQSPRRSQSPFQVCTLGEHAFRNGIGAPLRV